MDKTGCFATTGPDKCPAAHLKDCRTERRNVHLSYPSILSSAAEFGNDT